MQHRMKTHPLSQEKIENLLAKSQTGSLATLSIDGAPYVTPVHFIHVGEALYIHGLPKGKKIDNIIRNSKVSFSVYEMSKFLLDSNGNPCDTNTEYESVIIIGTAAIIEDLENKKMILKKIVEKYTPNLINKAITEGMIKSTAVIRIDISELTGKYYK